MSDRQGDNAARNMPTFVALAAMLFVGGGLLFLVSLVLPQAAGLILVLIGFVLFGFLHYITWGRLLARRHSEEDDDAE